MEAEEYINERNLRPRFGIPERTAQRWRKDGGGPPYVRRGTRRILYRVSDVEHWLAESTFKSRAEELSRVCNVAPSTPTDAKAASNEGRITPKTHRRYPPGHVPPPSPRGAEAGDE